MIELYDSRVLCPFRWNYGTAALCANIFAPLKNKTRRMKHSLILWMTFSLPICAAYGQEALTLEQCRQLAIDNNKELKIAEAQVDRAAQERRAARTKYFPQLSATGSYIHNSKPLELVDYSRFEAMTGQLLPQLAPLLMKYPQLAQSLPQIMEELKNLKSIEASV